MAQIWSILENVLCVPEKNMDSAAVGGFLIVLVSHSFWGKVAVMLKGAQTALWRGPYSERNWVPQSCKWMAHLRTSSSPTQALKRAAAQADIFPRT